VNLPEIDVVRAQPPERLLELALRGPGVAPVRAHLRHQERSLAPILDGAPHAHLALAVEKSIETRC
jgi:hypothetical protein